MSWSSGVAVEPAHETPPLRPDEYGHIFLQTVEATGTGLAVLDTGLRLLETNEAFRRQSGAGTSGPLHGRALAELLHPAARGLVQQHFARLQRHRRMRFEARLPAFWPTAWAADWKLTGMAVAGVDGRVRSFVLLVRPHETGPGDRVLVSPGKRLQHIDASILEGVAAGGTTVQLATNLYLSRQGIEYHVGNMLRRFKVTNRAALVSKAYSMGLFTVGSWPPRVAPEYVIDKARP